MRTIVEDVAIRADLLAMVLRQKKRFGPNY